MYIYVKINHYAYFYYYFVIHIHTFSAECIMKFIKYGKFKVSETIGALLASFSLCLLMNLPLGLFNYWDIILYFSVSCAIIIIII